MKLLKWIYLAFHWNTRTCGDYFPGLTVIKKQVNMIKKYPNHNRTVPHANLSKKFILLINFKMSTFVGILTFISRIHTTSESLI